MFLKRRSAAEYVFVLVCLVLFALAFYHVASLTQNTGSTFVFADSAILVPYILGMIGGMFGAKSATAAELAGLPIALCLVAIAASIPYRNGLSAAQRVALVCILTSLMMMASFAIGRHKYGLPWALAYIHYAPLTTPLFLGITLRGLEQLQNNSWDSSLSLV